MLEAINKGGSALGIIGALVAIYLVGTQGNGLANAAEGFAKAGGSLITVLQGR